MYIHRRCGGEVNTMRLNDNRPLSICPIDYTDCHGHTRDYHYECFTGKIEFGIFSKKRESSGRSYSESIIDRFDRWLSEHRVSGGHVIIWWKISYLNVMIISLFLNTTKSISISSRMISRVEWSEITFSLKRKDTGREGHGALIEMSDGWAKTHYYSERTVKNMPHYAQKCNRRRNRKDPSNIVTIFLSIFLSVAWDHNISTISVDSMITSWTLPRITPSRSYQSLEVLQSCCLDDLGIHRRSRNRIVDEETGGHCAEVHRFIACVCFTCERVSLCSSYVAYAGIGQWCMSVIVDGTHLSNLVLINRRTTTISGMLHRENYILCVSHFIVIVVLVYSWLLDVCTKCHDHPDDLGPLSFCVLDSLSDLTVFYSSLHACNLSEASRIFATFVFSWKHVTSIPPVVFSLAARVYQFHPWRFVQMFVQIRVLITWYVIKTFNASRCVACVKSDHSSSTQHATLSSVVMRVLCANTSFVKFSFRCTRDTQFIQNNLSFSQSLSFLFSSLTI